MSAAAKSRPAAVVTAHLLAVSRSLSCGAVIILHTSEGVLHLTASPALWASLRGLLTPKPFSSPGRPPGIKTRRTGPGRPKGVGLSLSPETRAALVEQIAAVRAGTRTHQAASELLGITRSAFTKWLGRLPVETGKSGNAEILKS